MVGHPQAKKHNVRHNTPENIRCIKTDEHTVSLAIDLTLMQRCSSFLSNCKMFFHMILLIKWKFENIVITPLRS